MGLHKRTLCTCLACNLKQDQPLKSSKIPKGDVWSNRLCVSPRMLLPAATGFQASQRWSLVTRRHKRRGLVNWLQVEWASFMTEKNYLNNHIFLIDSRPLLNLPVISLKCIDQPLAFQSSTSVWKYFVSPSTTESLRLYTSAMLILVSVSQFSSMVTKYRR